MTKRGEKKHDSRRYIVIGVIAALAIGGALAISFYFFPQYMVSPQPEDSPLIPEGVEDLEQEDQTSDEQFPQGLRGEQDVEELEERTPGQVIPTAVVVDPRTSTPGSTVAVHGDGFDPEERVTLFFNNTTIETTPQNLITDESGQFDAEITIPPEVESGEHTIAAEDESGNTASMLIDIESQPVTEHPIPQEEPTAEISVTPVSLQEGRFTIAGDGFTPNERIVIMVDDMEVQTEEEVITDEIGNFSVEADLPIEGNGEHIISASDESNQSASTTYP